MIKMLIGLGIGIWIGIEFNTEISIIIQTIGSFAAN